MNSKEIQVGSRTIEISKSEKLIYPDDGITKANLAEYYFKIAEIMLPHTRERPLSMQRFPDGIAESGFYEKQIPDYFPNWISRAEVEVKEEGETQQQVLCNNSATLVYLANQACITPHIWLSRVDDLNFPDKMIFDLDPPGDDFEPVRFAARALRKILEEVGINPFLMTTGSRGLHVVAPLNRSTNFETTRNYAHKLVNALAKREPDKLTTETRKNQRQGRLFLDYLRNAYGQTSVPPYALRPIPGCPVATPIEWEELDDTDLDSQTYTIKNIFRRLAQKEDPWKEIYSHAISLESHFGKLDRIMD